jgi:hypothetical protein
MPPVILLFIFSETIISCNARRCKKTIAFHAALWYVVGLTKEVLYG